MRALGPVLLVLISYSIIITVYAMALRHRIKASKDPLLILPRNKRIAHVEKMHQREQEEYEAEKQAHFEQQVKQFFIPATPTHKEEKEPN